MAVAKMVKALPLQMPGWRGVLSAARPKAPGPCLQKGLNGPVAALRKPKIQGTLDPFFGKK